MNEKRIVELLEDICKRLDSIEYAMYTYEKAAEAGVIGVEERVDNVEVEIANLRHDLKGIVHAIPYIKTELAVLSFNTGVQRQGAAIKQPEDRASAESRAD